MSTVQEWLPLGVVTRGPVTSKVGQAIADWSARWFVRERITATRFVAQTGGAQNGSGWRRLTGPVAINASLAATARLLDAALDARTDQLAATVADRRLLDLFEASLLEDLNRSVEAALEAADSGPPEARSPGSPFGAMGGLSVILTDTSGTDLLALAIPYEVLLPHCIASLDRDQPAGGALRSLTTALGPSPVTVEASLGQVEVPLRDLGSLAPGDVLVLDKALEADLDICLAGSDRLVARARLTQIDGHVALVLQA